MKNVLIITPGFLPLLGGMEEQVYLLGKEMVNAGNTVTVLTEKTKPTFPSRENYDGINVKRVNIIFCRKFSLPLIFFSYVNHLIKNKYDLIIVRTFTLPALVTGFLKRVGLLKTKTVVTAETGGVNDDIELISKRLFSNLIYYVIKGNDFFNCICDDNYRHLIKHKFPKEKITRIYNGINLSPFINSYYPKKINNYLFLGQLRKEKGIWELIKAFEDKKITNNLYIGGDGPEKPLIIKYISKNNLKNKIFILGRISKEEKADFFSKGEALILPSYSEGFPLVILEAISRKKIIITTDVSDIRKIFGDNVYYCAKKDPESIRKIINKLSKNDFKQPNYDIIKEVADIKSVSLQFLSIIYKS
ncbi:TPA: hypothetical protein DEP81_01865 [Candidatus Woesebacteria bacterium]|nr:hypothetical protein [Candidatus Woesebacteria bacterium]